MSPEFLPTALVVVLAPGTGVIYTLATGPAAFTVAARKRGSGPGLDGGFSDFVTMLTHA